MRPVGSIYGMPVFLSEMQVAIEIRPRRVHKKTRHQSDKYHERVQKKWNKRYGTDTVRVPAAYRIDLSILGLQIPLGGVNVSRHGVVMHPALYEQLKTAAGAELP